jgi:hypothetical protein
LCIAHTQVAQVLVRQFVGRLRLDDSLVDLTNLAARNKTTPGKLLHSAHIWWP